MRIENLLVRWFRKDEVIGSRVLVCGLGNQFGTLVSNDGDIYQRFYSSTIKTFFETTSELLEAISRRQYDIVHLFCDISHDGTIANGDVPKVTGTDLIEQCCASGVKLLWIPIDNPPAGYITNFRAKGKHINLVMTIKRNDPNFSAFLGNLLSKMHDGVTIPNAWAELNPQVPGSQESNAPAMIFYAGRGGVKLR